MAQGVEAGTRAPVAERLRELLPIGDEETKTLAISGGGFILDLDAGRRQRLLIRLLEARAAGRRLLAEGRDYKDARALANAYRYEMRTRFLPLIFAITDLFEE